MHTRHDVLAEMWDELFGATNEHVANLLLVALPVDARRIEGGVRLQLERVFARRRHFGLMKGGDVQEEGSLLDVAPRKIAHSPVDIVVRVDEVQALDLRAIRFEVHIDAQVDLEDRRGQRRARQLLAQVGRHVLRLEHLQEGAPCVTGGDDGVGVKAAAVGGLDPAHVAIVDQDASRLAASEQRPAAFLEHLGQRLGELAEATARHPHSPQRMDKEDARDDRREASRRGANACAQH